MTSTHDFLRTKRLYEQAQARLRETVRGSEHWPNTSYLGLRRTWMAGQ